MNTQLENDWQQDAIKLHKTQLMSGRQIAKTLGRSKSAVNDLIAKYNKALGISVIPEKSITHLVIFDTQVRPGIDLDYLRWIGEYIAHKKPDVIIMIGDFADMESLSSYDKGRKSAEGKRVYTDIEVVKVGMEELLKPIKTLQVGQKINGEVVYSPRMVMTLGNHEDRITRHVDANPELHGFLSIGDLGYEKDGWEVVPFLTPININGVNYCHFFPNVMTGKPLGGTAANMLKTIGESFTMGHRQLLDVSVRTLQASGQQQWGVICGSSYVHDEVYKGVQGNKHWRGIMMCHNVKEGSYDPLFISMDWLKKKYGK